MSSTAIAPQFRPTFRPSDLVLFTGGKHVDQKNVLRLLFKYQPFRKYKPKKPTKIPAQNVPIRELKQQDKELIRNEWKSQLPIGGLKRKIEFNDQKVIEKVTKKITESFLNELDDDSNETKIIKNMDFSLLENKSNFKLDYDLEISVKQAQMTNLENYTNLVKTSIYMERGNLFESPVIEKINQEHGYKFVQNKELIKKEFDCFAIQGIVDGIDTERKMIIEVKTRNELFKNKSWTYKRERLQCLCYMKLTGCTGCILVECGPNGEIVMNNIEWDSDEFQTEIVDKLTEFVTKYREISEEEFIKLASIYSYYQLY